MTEVIYPLFSSPVYGKVIGENLKDIFSSLKKEPFEPANNEGTCISTTKKILDKYPRLEKVLLKEYSDLEPVAIRNNHLKELLKN